MAHIPLPTLYRWLRTAQQHRELRRSTAWHLRTHLASSLRRVASLIGSQRAVGAPLTAEENAAKHDLAYVCLDAASLLCSPALTRVPFRFEHDEPDELQNASPEVDAALASFRAMSASSSLHDVLDMQLQRYLGSWREHTLSESRAQLQDHLEYVCFRHVETRTLLSAIEALELPSTVPSSQDVDKHSHRHIRDDSVATALRSWSTLPQRVDLRHLCEWAAEDCHGLCIEKFGVAPLFEVTTPASSSASSASSSPLASSSTSSFSSSTYSTVVIPSYVHFVLMELLKNASTAMVDRYGVQEVDIAPPVQLRLQPPSQAPSRPQSQAVSASHLFAEHGATTLRMRITVRDHGSGYGEDRRKRFEFFSSSHRTDRSPSYTYSGDFGAPLTGLGVGLAQASLHARYLGGSISLCSPQDGSAGTLAHMDLRPRDRRPVTGG